MRIALAQLNPTVGDVVGNAALIMQAIDQARRDRADMLMTSELVLIGYPPRDLLQREGVVEACETALQKVAEYAGDLCVLVGHPRRSGGGVRPWRNSVSVCKGGRVIAVADKQLLPGYDVFDEDRYFDPGEKSLVIDITGARCGVVICEDLWRANDVTAKRRYPVEPMRELARQKCQVILSLNASPFVLGKWQRHLHQLRDIATQFDVPIIAVNQVGANDDQVFDGRSVVLDQTGTVREVLAGFDSEVRTVEIAVKTQGLPFLGPATTLASINQWVNPNAELFHALALGIRDYCRKTGNTQALLGLSGGIDSALVAVLAAAALGPKNVHGVMMPSKFSSAGSIDDSIDLARRLGLGSCLEASIKMLHEVMQEAVGAAMNQDVRGVADENIQARVRGVILMAMSNAIPGALVLATSNKSEMATGYSTLYGDMCGAIAPLGDMTKTRIYELAKWINANHAACGFAKPSIPENSITKPPSAELRPNQTDQDTLPPYEVLDQIIERYIELEQSASTITAESGIDATLVNKTVRMIDRAQYKRDQAPVVLKVTGRAFGPGRTMPMVMKESLSVMDQESSGSGGGAGGAAGCGHPDGHAGTRLSGAKNPAIQVSSQRG